MAIPSWRGMSPVALVIIAGLALPNMTSPHGGTVSRQVLAFGSALLLLTAATSMMALFSGRCADKVAGVFAGSLTVWLTYAFFNAVF
jgi:hypothetical protein